MGDENSTLLRKRDRDLKERENSGDRWMSPKGSLGILCVDECRWKRKRLGTNECRWKRDSEFWGLMNVAESETGNSGCRWKRDSKFWGLMNVAENETGNSRYWWIPLKESQRFLDTNECRWERDSEFWVLMNVAIVRPQLWDPELEGCQAESTHVEEEKCIRVVLSQRQHVGTSVLLSFIAAGFSCAV